MRHLSFVEFGAAAWVAIANVQAKKLNEMLPTETARFKAVIDYLLGILTSNDGRLDDFKETFMEMVDEEEVVERIGVSILQAPVNTGNGIHLATSDSRYHTLSADGYIRLKLAELAGLKIEYSIEMVQLQGTLSSDLLIALTSHINNQRHRIPYMEIERIKCKSREDGQRLGALVARGEKWVIGHLALEGDVGIEAWRGIITNYGFGRVYTLRTTRQVMKRG